MGNLCGGSDAAFPSKEETKRAIDHEWKTHSELHAKMRRIADGASKEAEDGMSRGVADDYVKRKLDTSDAASLLQDIERRYLAGIAVRLEIDPMTLSTEEYHRQYTSLTAFGDELFGSSECQSAMNAITLLQ